MQVTPHRRGTCARRWQMVRVGQGDGCVVCQACTQCARHSTLCLQKGKKPSSAGRHRQLSALPVQSGLWVPALAGGSPAAHGLPPMLTCISAVQGFGWLAWLVVALQVFGGLIVGMVVKYADNILKNFANALSVIFTVIGAMPLFGQYPSIFFLFGVIMVLLSVFMYGKSAQVGPKC